MSAARPSPAPPTDEDAEIVARALRLESFFPEFSGELCAKVFPRSGVRAYGAGERLIEQGDTGRDLYVLLDGEVSITMSMGSAGAELARLDSGCLIGEMALLSGEARKASAVAETSARAFNLSYEDVGYLLKNNPELAAHLESLARERRT